MKKGLKLGILALLIVVVLFAFSACDSNQVTEEGVELLKNGSFESATTSSSTQSTTIDDWSYGSANMTAARTDVSWKRIYDTNDDQVEGSYYLKIANTTSNANYVYQSVEVDSKAVYKISVKCRIDTAIAGGVSYAGAHVTFLENSALVLGEVATGTGQWRTITVYVRPIRTDYLTVCLKVGTEKGSATGVVSFDEASMKRVSTVPAGTTITDVQRVKIARYNETASGTAFVVLLTLATCAIMAVGYVLLRRLYSKKNALESFDATPISSEDKKAKIKKFFSNQFVIFGLIALVTAAIRLIIMLTTYGFGSETSTLVSDARNVFRLSPTGFYSNAALTTSLDSKLRTPGALYILYFFGGMGQNMTDYALAQFLRVPALLGDLAVIAMLFFYGKKYVGNKVSTIWASLYALLPIAFTMSGLRGSFDSITVALLLATFILLIEKKYIPMFVTMLFAVLLSMSALAVAPLIVCYMVYIYVRDRELNTLLTLIGSLVACFCLFYLLSLPFTISYEKSGQAFYILTKYADMMRLRTSFVDNAFNLYGMVTMNNKSVNSTAAIFNLLFILVLVIYAISLYLKNKNRLELLLLSSFTFAIIAVFTLKISATYLFLAIAPLMLYTMLAGEKRLYIVLAGYALLMFLNIGQTANISGFIGAATGGAIVNYETKEAFYIFFSVLAVLLTLYYGYVVYSICNNGKRVDILPMKDSFYVTTRNFWKDADRRFKLYRAAKAAARAEKK